MEFKIERSLDIKNFHYAIGNGKFKGISNFTYGILPAKIRVFYSNTIWELRQTSYVLKLINKLPILNSEDITPFRMYVNNVCIGKSKKLIFKPVFFFNTEQSIFELRQHNHNYISLMKDEFQVALFKKEDVSTAEKNRYTVKCIEDEQILPLVILFCLFTDVVFYPNEGRIDYLKYEKSYVFNDLYSNRILWEPQD